MSLINDMLRDLSRQQENRQSEVLTLADMPTDWEQEKIVNFFQQYSRIPVFIASIIIFVLAVLLIQWVVHSAYFSNGHKPIVSTDNIQESISETILIKDQLFEEKNINSKPINDANKPAVVADYNVQQTIYRLIEQASRAMTLDRLTSPENDNAYFYYRELLKLDSANEIAISGLQRIVDRYLQMADQSIQKMNISKADYFLDKASDIGIHDQRIAEVRNQLISLSEKDKFEDKRVESNSAPAIMIEESITVNDPFESTKESTLKNTSLVGASSSLTITPNLESLDQQTVKEMKDWVAQGFKSRAIEKLENHILLYPAPLSEQYLLDLYYQEKNVIAMQRLLDFELASALVDKTYYRARLNILNGDNQTAIHLLELELPSAVKHENYRALLAGLYQREQLYVQSVSAYRNLLNSFSPKPGYWLGLALSLDAQNQSLAAIHAYQQILHFPQLESQVQNYAQQRIAQLSRDH